MTVHLLPDDGLRAVSTARVLTYELRATAPNVDRCYLVAVTPDTEITLASLDHAAQSVTAHAVLLELTNLLSSRSTGTIDVGALVRVTLDKVHQQGATSSKQWIQRARDELAAKTPKE